MVVDHGRGLWIVFLQPFTAPKMIRAIDENRRAVVRRFEDLIRLLEFHAIDQEAQPARHRVRIDANRVVSVGGQNARERNLRANAIAIGPGVTNHGDLPARDRGKQPGKLRRQLWVKFLHGYDRSSMPPR